MRWRPGVNSFTGPRRCHPPEDPARVRFRRTCGPSRDLPWRPVPSGFLAIATSRVVLTWTAGDRPRRRRRPMTRQMPSPQCRAHASHPVAARSGRDPDPRRVLAARRRRRLRHLLRRAETTRLAGPADRPGVAGRAPRRDPRRPLVTGWENIDDMGRAIDAGAPVSYVLMHGNKSIVGALIGGYAGGLLVKRRLGYARSTGDAYVLALPIAMAIGRVGCFLAELPLGTATTLPWGMTVDPAAAAAFPRCPDCALPMHPSMLYEIGFNLLAIPVLLWARPRVPVPGDLLEGLPPRGGRVPVRRRVRPRQRGPGPRPHGAATRAHPVRPAARCPLRAPGAERDLPGARGTAGDGTAAHRRRTREHTMAEVRRGHRTSVRRPGRRPSSRPSRRPTSRRTCGHMALGTRVTRSTRGWSPRATPRRRSRPHGRRRRRRRRGRPPGPPRPDRRDHRHRLPRDLAPGDAAGDHPEGGGTYSPARSSPRSSPSRCSSPGSSPCCLRGGRAGSGAPTSAG